MDSDGQMWHCTHNHLYIMELTETTNDQARCGTRLVSCLVCLKNVMIIRLVNFHGYFYFIQHLSNYFGHRKIIINTVKSDIFIHIFLFRSVRIAKVLDYCQKNNQIKFFLVYLYD